MRARWLAVAALAACDGGSARPATYTHADPAFAIDLPPGFRATEAYAPGGSDAMAIDFLGPHPRDRLSIEWRAWDGSAVAARDADAHLETLMNHANLSAAGDSPSAWYEAHGHPDQVVAYLVVGTMLVKCFTTSDAALAACKSLRP